MSRRSMLDVIRDPAFQAIVAVLALIVTIIGLPFVVPLFSHQSPASTPQATIVPSSISRNYPTATPIPSPTPAAPTPTPTPTETPCPTAAASTNSTTGNVDALVTAKGCSPASYPVTWVFGFVQGNGIGMTSGSFMSYGAGQNLGNISQLGIAPTAPYSGPPHNSWLFWVNSGGYAIVISDTIAQPTADQLGTATLHGGFVNWAGGTYLSPTYVLTSTTPQPGGNQGYQFNLVVKT